MVDLDNTDYKILRQLDLNARIPVSRLAKNIRLSRDTVNYRIRRLEKNNVIRGYNSIIDVSRLGFKIYRVYLKFKSISSEDNNNIVRFLSEYDPVFWLGECDGMYDIVFGIWVKDEHEFYSFYRSLIKKYRTRIKIDLVNQVISYSYIDRNYLYSSRKRQEKIIGRNKTIGYDEIDKKILGILARNSREKIINMAQKTGLESSAVIYRIKQLETKGVIIGYKADLNFRIIKRYFYSIKLYIDDFKRINELISFLKSKDFVTNFTEAIGGYDIEFDIEIGSEGEYYDFIKELKDRYDFISEISFFRVHKNYKVLSMPNII